MKVAAKSAIGAGLLLVPLVGALAHHVNQVDRLAGINRDLSAIQFSAATLSLDLIRQFDLLDEYASKYAVTQDADYVAKFMEARRAVGLQLRSLHALRLSPDERIATRRLTATWTAFLTKSDLGADQQAATADTAAASDDGTARRWRQLQALLARLRNGARAVITASRSTIASEVASSARASERTELISWAVAGGTLCLSLLVVFFTVRAVNRPLKTLTEATQTVSKGRFTLQVDLSQDDEFTTLARAFNAMVQRLGELDQMKQEFLSHVSHELKNPLVAMQETNRLLLDGLPGALTPKQRRLLELNLDGGERLSAMIADLLDLSRLEAGATYDLEPRDLVDLISNATEAFEARALEKHIGLRVKSPDKAVPLRCDGDRIIQVMQNLLENALKFSPRDSTVTINIDIDLPGPDVRKIRERLMASRQDKAPTIPGMRNYALVSVNDDGPGIPDADKERVFEKFYQAGRRARQAVKGVGLGLAICREIVEAHQGAIWATDGRGGKGTTVAFALPRVVDEQPTDSKADSKAEASHDQGGPE